MRSGVRDLIYQKHVLDVGRANQTVALTLEKGRQCATGEILEQM